MKQHRQMMMNNNDGGPVGNIGDILRLGQDEEPWQLRGLCAQTDPEIFYPEKGGTTNPAKRVCLVCDVRDECLQYALDNEERHGIWGGLSERERRKMKKRVLVAAPDATPDEEPDRTAAA